MLENYFGSWNLLGRQFVSQHKVSRIISACKRVGNRLERQLVSKYKDTGNWLGRHL
jgi:hypothetical protein